MQIDLNTKKVDSYLSVGRKLRDVNFKTYALCEPIDEIGYNLLIRDENGIVIKSQYHKWKANGKNKMATVNIPSKWVKANVNVFQGDVCVIQNEGKTEPNNIDPTKQEWHFDIKLPNEEVKDCKFNKESLTNFIEKFGKESTEWVGKEIVASKIVNYPKGAGIVWEAK